MEWVVIAVIVCFLAMAAPMAYRIGLSFSRGYHKGKREHLQRILSDDSICPKGGIE